MVKHLAAPSVTPWSLPDQDAAVYLDSALERGSLRADKVHGYLDFLYQNVMDWSDMAGLKATLERAEYSVDIGDAEEVVASFTDLTQWGYDFNTDHVENWAQQLFDKALSPAARLRQRHATLKDIERRTIRAIDSLCRKLCELIAKDGCALNQIDWRQLEMVVATALDGLGFDVTLTPASKDGGKDIIASTRLVGRDVVFFVELKHWRSGKMVGAQQVFDFVELNLFSQTDGGLFLSTSGFNGGVYSQLGELTRDRVWLAGKEKVVTLCQQYSRKDEALWRSHSTLPQLLFDGIYL